jgi:hypothetical protein
MDDLISRKALIAEYDRVHIGPPGGARKLMEDAPAVNPLPCKIGDTVWGIRYHTGVPYIKQGTVSEMAYLDDMRLAIAVKFAPKYNTRGFWGVTIFATREECEAALGGTDNEIQDSN